MCEWGVQFKDNENKRRTDDNQECDTGEGSTPCNTGRNILDAPDSARSGSQNNQFDIVDDEANYLQESTSHARKTLQDNITVVSMCISRYIKFVVMKSYVKKKVDAVGKCIAKIDGIDVGL